MAMSDLSRAASALHGLLRNPKAGAEEVRRAQSAGKRALLQEGLLVPSGKASVNAHKAARYILEASMLLALRAHDWDGFGRYWGALAPFYELGRAAYPPGEARGQRAKITGLYLLFLLTEGDYAGFHTLIEALQAESDNVSNDDDDSDDDDSDSDSDSDDDEKGPIISNHSVMYPIKMERWMMEGSYDRVWELAKDKRLPSEEFGVFSQVLIRTIREEIASCSEKAYPSIPVQNAKNLLFLSSEGAVVSFAQERGWTVRDGRIYFPAESAATSSSDRSPSGDGDDDDDKGGSGAAGGSRSAAPPMPSSSSRNERKILATSGTVIENTIGYARELETIV